MSSSRILLLGEGERDVGRIDPAVKRRPPCDFEGDLPRLVRRLSEHHAGRARVVAHRCSRGFQPFARALLDALPWIQG